MCIYIYVCMHACMHACMYVCMYTLYITVWFPQKCRHHTQQPLSFQAPGIAPKASFTKARPGMNASVQHSPIHQGLSHLGVTFGGNPLGISSWGHQLVGGFNLPYIWLVYVSIWCKIPVIIILSYLTGWWFQPTPLKNMSRLGWWLCPTKMAK